jgi:hypothetical protein
MQPNLPLNEIHMIGDISEGAHLRQRYMLWQVISPLREQKLAIAVLILSCTQLTDKESDKTVIIS